MSDILARLIAQSEGRGCDLVTLRALIEEAVEAGVRRAQGTETQRAKTEDTGLVRRMMARCRKACAQLLVPFKQYWRR